jgi:hypothetical protein
MTSTSTLYENKWLSAPTNIQINDLLYDLSFDELYDKTNILVGNYLDIEIKYYTKFPLDVYIEKKIQSKILEDSIIEKDIILKDEYDKLSFTNKQLYIVHELRRYQDGYDSVYNDIISYIKYTVKQYQDEQAKIQSKILENCISEKNIITKDEYNKLSFTNKQLYIVYEKHSYRDGYDSVHTDIINYIKVTTLKYIEEQTKLSLFLYQQYIIKKPIIYHDDYKKLTDDKKILYIGIKATQTELSKYREGLNYYELYGKPTITEAEYNQVYHEYKKYYKGIESSSYIYYIFYKKYKQFNLI